MMYSETNDENALFPLRKVKCAFEPALPDGCTWELFAEMVLVTSGKVGPDEKTSLEVDVRAKADAKLVLRVKLPLFTVHSHKAIEEEGGLVVVDCADIVCA